MSLFFFYHNRKPRSFEHKQIYYDPQKDALNERVERIRKEMKLQEVDEGTDSKQESRIRGSFIKGATYLKKRKNQKNTSFSLLLSVFMMAIFLSAFVFFIWYLFNKS